MSRLKGTLIGKGNRQTSFEMAQLLLPPGRSLYNRDSGEEWKVIELVQKRNLAILVRLINPNTKATLNLGFIELMLKLYQEDGSGPWRFALQE